MSEPLPITETITLYQWSLVIEGMCPICKADIALIHFTSEGWKYYQCGGCERVYVEDEEGREPEWSHN